MGQRKRYTKEFKLEAVRLAQEPDQTFPGVSINLGISNSSLHRWAKEFERQLRSCSFRKNCLEHAFGPMMGCESKRTTFQTALF